MHYAVDDSPGAFRIPVFELQTITNHQTNAPTHSQHIHCNVSTTTQELNRRSGIPIGGDTITARSRVSIYDHLSFIILVPPSGLETAKLFKAPQFVVSATSYTKHPLGRAVQPMSTFHCTKGSALLSSCRPHPIHLCLSTLAPHKPSLSPVPARTLSSSSTTSFLPL